jgi:uncharacterized damage-inducible protein DinB
MRELDRIADQLRRAVDGGAWHGPSLLEILAAVDAQAAAARTVAGVHSIWEILHHITAWSRAVVRRLNGETLELTDEQDWPSVREPAQAAWLLALDDFRAAQQEVQTKIKSMSNDELGMPVPGKPYNNWFMLMGLVQHHLYHAGQIALLKKAAASSQ